MFTTLCTKYFCRRHLCCCKSLSLHLRAQFSINMSEITEHYITPAIRVWNTCWIVQPFALLFYYYYCFASSAILVPLVVVSCTRRKAAIKPNQFRNPKITPKLFSCVAARIRSPLNNRKALPFASQWSLWLGTKARNHYATAFDILLNFAPHKAIVGVKALKGTPLGCSTWFTCVLICEWWFDQTTLCRRTVRPHITYDSTYGGVVELLLDNNLMLVLMM